jgi:hypothetical protein
MQKSKKKASTKSTARAHGFGAETRALMGDLIAEYELVGGLLIEEDLIFGSARLDAVLGLEGLDFELGRAVKSADVRGVPTKQIYRVFRREVLALLAIIAERVNDSDSNAPVPGPHSLAQAYRMISEADQIFENRDLSSEAGKSLRALARDSARERLEHRDSECETLLGALGAVLLKYALDATDPPKADEPETHEIYGRAVAREFYTALRFAGMDARPVIEVLIAVFSELHAETGKAA